MIIGEVYCNGMQIIYKNSKRVLADIEISQAVRFIESTMRRDISYNTAEIKIVKDLNNRNQIVCRKTLINDRTYWYISNFILYRKVIKGSATGINSFSNPKIKILDWQVVPLGEKKLGIIMTLKEVETGYSKKKSFTMLLSNSCVTS